MSHMHRMTFVQSAIGFVSTYFVNMYPIVIKLHADIRDNIPHQIAVSDFSVNS